MASQDFTTTQIQMLRRRWQDEPSVHVSLQLADLYRQRGELDEAVEVVQRSLEAHPDRVSIKVALGRYRLESGNAAGAADVLERVVDQDAVHLVANKILVRAYIALGDLKRAADRLDLYAVLNDGDPELGTLRAAVVSADAPQVLVSGLPLAEPFATPTQVSAEAADLSSMAPPAATPSRGLSGALDRAPFESLLERPLAPASVASLFGLVERAGREAAAAADDTVTVAEPTLDEAPDWAQEGAGPPEAPEAVADAEPIRPITEGARSVEDLIPEPEVPAVEAEAPRELDAGAAATSTLGSLYLAQGHLDEAQSTFERVLQRDPDDAEAKAGLAAIADQRSTSAGTAPSSGSNTKVNALQSYLDRIRSAADRLSA